MGGEPLLHVQCQLILQFLRTFETGRKDNECLHNFRSLRVRYADNRRFVDGCVLKKGTFDVEWSDAITR